MGNGMNKILPGLYVGNFRDAKDQAQLKENNITHILSIHDNAKELLDDKKYLCIIASDTASQNLLQFFPQCIEFIHEARHAHGGVLVHCLAGVSRSVTVTAAYIMTVTNLGWRDSLNAIRGARNCANPNFGFQKQLQEYENEGLDVAREKLKADYPYSQFTDAQDCEILLKSYRNYVNCGELDDTNYVLPYKAYTKRNKLKDGIYKPKNDNNDDGDKKNENGDNNDNGGDNEEKGASGTLQNGEESSPDKDGDLGSSEESRKGKELVERQKWEVTAVQDDQQGACGVDTEDS